MQYLYIFLFFILFSCGYPDIDTVPNFNNATITDEEKIDTCKILKMTNDFDFDFLNCLSDIYDEAPDFNKLDISEENARKLCNRKNKTTNERIICLRSFYKTMGY